MASLKNTSYLFNHWHQSCWITCPQITWTVSNTKDNAFGADFPRKLLPLPVSLQVIPKGASCYQTHSFTYSHLANCYTWEFIFTVPYIPKTYLNSFVLSEIKVNIKSQGVLVNQQNDGQCQVIFISFFLKNVFWNKLGSFWPLFSFLPGWDTNTSMILSF